jgi:transcriptional regulator with XRE-family HTH domain
MSNRTNEILTRFKDIENEINIELERDMIQLRFISELEELMELKGINKMQLAGLLGVSASFLTQVFKAKKTLNLALLAKLNRIFDIRFEITSRSSFSAIRTNIYEIQNENSEINYLRDSNLESFMPVNSKRNTKKFALAA